MIVKSNYNFLDKFIGKYCSFFVTQHQKQFNNQTDLLYFSGFVTEINSLGIIYTSIKENKINYINFTHLIAICEENILYKEEKNEENNINTIDDSHESTEQTNNPPLTIEDAEKLMENI